MNNIGRVGQGDSIQDWYRNIPFVTKVLVTSTVLLGGLMSFNIVNPLDLILDWNMIWKKFHIWRLFTPFIFAGGFSFNFLMHVLVLFENCRHYEINPFNTGAGGSSADFLWMITLGIIQLSIIGYFMDVSVLSESLLFMIMYVLSRREPESIRNIFGFKFKALYLPWVYVGLRLLMGGSIALPIIGIVVGHAYFFVIEVSPNIYNVDIIRTPKLCIDLVSYATGYTAPVGRPTPVAPVGPGAPPPAAFHNLGGGYNWGRGRQLGNQ